MKEVKNFFPGSFNELFEMNMLLKCCMWDAQQSLLVTPVALPGIESHRLLKTKGKRKKKGKKWFWPVNNFIWPWTGIHTILKKKWKLRCGPVSLNLQSKMCHFPVWRSAEGSFYILMADDESRHLCLDTHFLSNLSCKGHHKTVNVCYRWRNYSFPA